MSTGPGDPTAGPPPGGLPPHPPGPAPHPTGPVPHPPAPMPHPPAPPVYPPPGPSAHPPAPPVYPPPRPWAHPPRRNPWPVVAAVLIGLAAVACTVGAQAIAWLVEQILLVAGRPQPAWIAPLAGVLNAALVGGPAALLATLPRAAGVRAAGRVWLLAAGGLAAASLPRALPPPQHELYLAALALLLGGAALLVRRIRRDASANRAPGLARALGFAAGAALLLPWLWLGALGGALESALAVAAAAAVGFFAAALLDREFWAAYAPGPNGSLVRPVLLGGTVAGVALALLAAGVGQRGAQLPALLMLPAAGFAAAALAAYARGAGTAPVGWLVGTAALGPLAFVDPEELTLLLAIGRDVPFWAAVAAAAATVVALLVGLGYGLTLARRRPASRRWVAAAVAAATVVAGAAVHMGLGQPGLHGERLFVVLKRQAELGDVTAAPGQAGRDARAREVYQRLVAQARESQAALRRDLRRLRLEHRPFYLMNAIEVDGGPAVRAWLSRHPDVDRVLLSQRARPLPAAPPTEHGTKPAPGGPAWNVTMIGADRVWSELGVTGSGIVVGTSDSGVDGRHPALVGGFRGGDDSWHDPWNHTRTPTDHSGHGTHTLGSAVGGQGIGVAPGARWVGCVNLDRNLGNPARYLDCLQFMLAPYPPGGDPFTDGRPERAPHVLTNSWGCPPLEGCDPAALRPATAALAAAGVFVVAAAGNTGPFCGSVTDPPATHGDVLSVGAVDRAGRPTEFSSRGPTPDGLTKPDLLAPGAGVVSAMPGGGYAALDGTSMAAPHVAGVVALLWSAEPRLIGDIETTARLLRQTARLVPLPSEGCDGSANLIGAGLVDAYAAISAARQ